MELQHVSIAIPPGGRNEARAFYGELLGLDERVVPPKLNPEELIWFRVGGDLELHLFDSAEAAPLSQHFCLRIDSGLEKLRRQLEDGWHRDARHRRDRRPAVLLLPRPVRQPCRADRGTANNSLALRGWHTTVCGASSLPSAR